MINTEAEDASELSSPQKRALSATQTQTPLQPRTHPIITLRISIPEQRLGLELYETKLKAGPQATLSPVVAIRSVLPYGLAAGSINCCTPGKPRLRPGMILLDYPTKTQLVDRVQYGPYPIELRFGAGSTCDKLKSNSKTIIVIDSDVDEASDTESMSSSDRAARSRTEKPCTRKSDGQSVVQAQKTATSTKSELNSKPNSQIIMDSNSDDNQASEPKSKSTVIPHPFKSATVPDSARSNKRLRECSV